MAKLFKTLVSAVITLSGFAWAYSAKAVTLLEHVMTVLHLPNISSEVPTQTSAPVAATGRR